MPVFAKITKNMSLFVMTESVGLFLKYEFCCQESTTVFTRRTRRPFPVLIILPHDPSVRIYWGKSTPSVAVFCCFCLFFPPLSWEECLIGPQRNATFSNPPNTRGECLPQRRETSVLWTRGNPSTRHFPGYPPFLWVDRNFLWEVSPPYAFFLSVFFFLSRFFHSFLPCQR